MKQLQPLNTPVKICSSLGGRNLEDVTFTLAILEPSLFVNISVQQLIIVLQPAQTYV